jgi:hypothetical protein
MALTLSASRHRAFICSPYLPNDQNELLPGTIKACPMDGFLAGYCRIVSKGWRERKCAPFQRLRRLRCRTHSLGFTIYPLGMTPYSRRSFIDSPNYFAAVADAIAGCKWPELTGTEEATFKTQKRHIKRLAVIFAVEPTLSEEERWQASLTLNISYLHLDEGAENIRAGPTYKGRARIVMGILNDYLDGAMSLAAVLHRGFSENLWGCPIINERDLRLA